MHRKIKKGYRTKRKRTADKGRTTKWHRLESPAESEPKKRLKTESNQTAKQQK